MWTRKTPYVGGFAGHVGAVRATVARLIPRGLYGDFVELLFGLLFKESGL